MFFQVEMWVKDAQSVTLTVINTAGDTVLIETEVNYLFYLCIYILKANNMDLFHLFIKTINIDE